MDKVTTAIKFTADAHDGMVRKKDNTPYILHPLEAAVIVGSMTEDRDVISAAVLHDVVEDTEITFDDFSFSETENPYMKNFYNKAVEACERLREDYLECMAEVERYTDPMMKEEARSHAKEYWNALIKILPCAYNQKRTVTLNYENLVNMYHSRRSHKLEEWHDLCSWVKSLPNSNLILLAAGIEE